PPDGPRPPPTAARRPFLRPRYGPDRMRYYPPFPGAIPHRWAGQARATQPSAAGAEAPARLACLTHAASVCPEPGSNSPSKNVPSTCVDDYVLLLDEAPLEPLPIALLLLTQPSGAPPVSGATASIGRGRFMRQA